MWTSSPKQFVAVVLSTRNAQADRTTRIAIVNGPEFGYELIEGGMALRVKSDGLAGPQRLPVCPGERTFSG